MTEFYFDHHTITKPDEEVIKAMLPFFGQKWGNVSQPHVLGQQLLPEITRAYQKIYHALNVGEENTVLFTSSGEEAINHVFDFVYRAKVREEGRNHLITLACEEAPIILNMQRLEKYGCFMTSVKTPGGLVNPKSVIEAITPRTALISLTYANGLTGVIHSLEEISEICRLRGIYLHLDISYSFGKVLLDFETIKPDFVTIGGDKIHSVKSSGALFARKEIPLQPFLVGGSEQGGLRGVALDTGSLVGFAHAMQKMQEHTDHMSTEIVRLRNLFEKQLSEQLKGITILFQENRLPDGSVIAFHKISSDALLLALSKRGVYATFGGSRMQKLSLLLENAGFPPQIANSALSFTFSRETSKAHIEGAVAIICDEVTKLRKLSNHLEEALWD